MSVPRLVHRPAAELAFPVLRIWGRMVEPYILDADDPDDVDLSVEYTIDEDDAVLALHVFVRKAMPGERADAMGQIAETSASLPEAARMIGLPTLLERRHIEDRDEASLSIFGEDLMLGAFVTTTEGGKTEAVLDFALANLVPLFVDRS